MDGRWLMMDESRETGKAPQLSNQRRITVKVHFFTRERAKAPSSRVRVEMFDESNKSVNKGLISVDRGSKATLLLTIPRSILSRLQRILEPRSLKLLFEGPASRRFRRDAASSVL